MITRACKLPRELCEYWEQYAPLGNCLARLVAEGQDILYIPRMIGREDCNTNRYIRIDDEATETFVNMGKHSCNLANVLYYYQQLGYPEQAGWEKNPEYIRKQEMRFTNDIFAISGRIEIALAHWPEHENTLRPMLETLRSLRYVEK